MGSGSQGLFRIVRRMGRSYLGGGNVRRRPGKIFERLEARSWEETRTILFLENPNRTDETCEKFVRNNSRGIAQKFCPILLTTDEESRATTRSLIVSAAFPRGTREIFPSTYTHTRARWWNVRKCAARSSLHARTEFIVACWIAHNRPWEIAIRAGVRSAPFIVPFRTNFIPIEIYSDPTKFPLLGRDFLLSSKSIRAKHPSSSYPPRHTLRNFHPSLETSVRMNFAKALIYEQPCQRCWGIFHVAPSHAKCLYLRHRRVSHGMDTLLVIDHDIMKASTSSGSRGSIFSRCKFVAFSICSKRSKN